MKCSQLPSLIRNTSRFSRIVANLVSCLHVSSSGFQPQGSPGIEDSLLVPGARFGIHHVHPVASDCVMRAFAWRARKPPFRAGPGLMAALSRDPYKQTKKSVSRNVQRQQISDATFQCEAPSALVRFTRSPLVTRDTFYERPLNVAEQESRGVRVKVATAACDTQKRSFSLTAQLLFAARSTT